MKVGICGIGKTLEKLMQENELLKVGLQKANNRIAMLQKNNEKMDAHLNECDESYQTIKWFIKSSGYTYTVQDVLDGYKKHTDGYYVSSTMKECIKTLESEIKTLLESGV